MNCSSYDARIDDPIRNPPPAWDDPGHAHYLTDSCYQRLPLLRTGDAIAGRVVAGSFIWSFQGMTGGSDGQPQSFNDSKQLAIELEFTDGSYGIYLVQPDW